MTGFVPNLSSARAYYAEIGLDTLPLRPNTKAAGVRAWQSRSPLDLWHEAMPGANIGIRCGGKLQLAVIDCDEKQMPGTFQNVKLSLDSIGLREGKYPLVQTASGGGRHIYIRVANAPAGNYKKLAPEIGAGEFRFGAGAYVVAPPSVVNDAARYALLSGDFANLPVVEYQDIAQFSHVGEKADKKGSGDISRNAWNLLKGDIPGHFPSRSEADQSLVNSLINTGFDFEGIKRLFMHNPTTGKFTQLYESNPKLGIQYLSYTYESGKRWTSSNVSRGRRIAQSAIRWAKSQGWPGRSGPSDRDVFLAHAEIAERCGKIVYAASSRDLGERANISHAAARNATKRLEKAGLVVLVEKAVANCAHKYRLNLNDENLGVTKMNKRDSQSFIGHDVFCYQGLGKSSELIWEQLQEGPRNIKELVTLTGKTRPTVKKWLEKMSKITDIRTGEIVAMVENVDGIWHAVEDVDLDYIAEIIGVLGIQANRKRKHQAQRIAHNRGLKKGKSALKK